MLPDFLSVSCNYVLRHFLAENTNCHVSDSSVLHGGENEINRHKDTSKHKLYVDAAQQQRKFGDLVQAQRKSSEY